MKIGFAVLLVTATCGLAQESVGPLIADQYRKAANLLRERNPTEAAQMLQALVDRYGDDATATVGPSFGNIYYHLGAARLLTKDTEAAIAAFRTCYVDFANPEDTGTEGNRYRHKALLQWAQLEQKRDKPAAAVQLLLRALKENEDPKLEQRILLNLGHGLRDLGDKPRAWKVYGKLVSQLDDGTGTPDISLRALLELALLRAESGQLPEVWTLLDRHGAKLKRRPEEMTRLNPLLIQIGRRCTLAGEPQLALEWYRYVGETDSMPDTMARAIRLARAAANFQLANYPAALSDYRRLCAESDLAGRDEVLHAAAVCASMTDKPDEAATYVNELHDTWPGYPRLPEVYTAWAESLLRGERQDEAYAVASGYRDALESGAAEREGLDFVVASAAYRKQQFPEAAMEFEAFAAAYPHSAQQPAARYYHAISLAHARDWEPAAALLDRLLDDAIQVTLKDGALYYRALCAAMLNHPDTAKDMIGRLAASHPGSPHLPAGLNLLGDLQFRASEWEDADRTYRNAAKRADALEDLDTVAAYARYQRVRVAMQQQSWEHAIARFQELETTHPQSAHVPQAAAAAATAHEAEGQADEALKLLTEKILQYADRVRDPALPCVLNAHHTLVKRTQGYEALIHRLDHFPSPDPTPRPLVGWLILGKIEALESIGADPTDERLNAWYRELTASFAVDQLDDYFLLKLARRLATEGDHETAITYYDELTEVRTDSEFKQLAQVELARQLRQSADAADHERALTLLNEVQADCEDPELQETAALETARIHTLREDWETAAGTWEGYLAQSDWLMARAEANYQLAACRDQLGAHDEALKLYLATYVHYEGFIDWSSRAFLRTALIHREKGRQEQALAVLDDMMNRMGHLSHPIIDRARTLHQQWKAK